MSHTVGRRPSRKQPRTTEGYILDSLPKVFKGGHWVEDTVNSVVSPSEKSPSQDRGEGVSAPENGSCGRTDPKIMGTRYITVIGGQKYGDKKDLMRAIPLDHQIVVGAGRGVESDLAKWGNGEVVSIPVNPDLYGKNARKVNVEQVLTFAPDSPLLLVGEGERVKQARAWLKRTNWPREVVELP